MTPLYSGRGRFPKKSWLPASVTTETSPFWHWRSILWLSEFSIPLTCIGLPSHQGYSRRLSSGIHLFVLSDGSPLTTGGDDGKSLPCPMFSIGYPSLTFFGWFPATHLQRSDPFHQCVILIHSTSLRPRPGEGSVPRLRRPRLSEILRFTQDDRDKRACPTLCIGHPS
jgi:hypothetical protein